MRTTEINLEFVRSAIANAKEIGWELNWRDAEKQLRLLVNDFRGDLAKVDIVLPIDDNEVLKLLSVVKGYAVNTLEKCGPL